MTHTPKYTSAVEPELSQTPPGGGLLLPSQQPPPTMPQLGYLTREHCNIVFQLYGQRKRGYGSVYEYYYEPSGGGRVPLCTRHERPLWTGDTVELPGQQGIWRVTLLPLRFP